MNNVPTLSDLSGPTSDDSVDRISHIYTVVLLIVFVIAVSSGQFFGEPIHCWIPAEFHETTFGDYTNNLCWVKNSYYIPMTESIPDIDSDKSEHEITYYQWIPLILLLQAFLFKFPNLVWSMMNSYSGVSMDKVIKLCNDTQSNTPEERQETIENLAMYMDKWLWCTQRQRSNIIQRVQKKISNILVCICSRRGGTYLTGLYLFSKLLYVVNAIGQLFLLNAFLAQDYNVYGLEYMANVIHNTPAKESPRFPRVTLCDVQIRQLNNLQPWTVQCVLPINLFNEKIYVVIWFWLVFVSIISGISFIRWIFHHFFQNDKVRYIKKYLKINKQIASNADKSICKQFAMNYLRDDGVFLLYMIGRNSSEMVVSDLVLELWKIYKAKGQISNDE